MFKNFFHILSRYTTSSILNIVGLTVAFTAFIIIMVQVSFDSGFDRFHPKSDRTYRVEYTEDSMLYGAEIGRPMGEHIIGISPYVEAGSVIDELRIDIYLPGQDPLKAIEFVYMSVHPAVTDMMDFVFVEGEAKLEDRGNIIISETIARQLFADQKAVGEELRFRAGSDKEITLMVTGVYRDFPKNSILESNPIIRNIGNSFIDDNSEWSFSYFLTLTNADKKADVEAEMAKYAKETLGYYEKFFFRLTPLPELHFTNDVEYDSVAKADYTTMKVLMSVAILILIIAAINFLNFAMALTPLRLKSINIQKILGGSVAQLRFLQITEAVFLALISFGLALLVVNGLSGTTFTGLMTAPLGLESNIDVLIMSGVVAIVTGVVAGIVPAFYSTSFKPIMTIKGAFGTSITGRRFRVVLIGFQYLCSIVLFCAAMFMVIQNKFMKSHPVGFDRENVACTYISGQASESAAAIRIKLMENPLIKDVAFSRGPIISNGKMDWGREFQGRQVNFDCFPVSTNFPKFMGMQIVEGRDFTEDDDKKAGGTLIFNQKAAAQIGFKVGDQFGGHHEDSLASVVGIVRNFNFQPMRYGIQPIALYVFGAEPWWSLPYMNVRIAGHNIPETYEFINKTVNQFEAQPKPLDIKFMDQAVGALYEKEENQAILISIFAAMAMVISLVGVLGLVIFETQHRRKEIGLRKINGATVALILMMFNRKFVRIVAWCFVISLPVAYYAVNEWLMGFAYRTPIYWWIFALALMIVLAITVTTVTIQSWKVATENPVNAIKAE